MTQKKLKPKSCPFCKNKGEHPTGVYVVNRYPGEEGDFLQHGCFVECDCCQATGPWHPYVENEDEARAIAIERWNARSLEEFQAVE